MLKIIKNVSVYTPEFIGKKDILLCDDKIAKIDDFIPIPPKEFYEVEVIDASEKYLLPGFIDLHVHIIGGGGEGGYITRTPEIQFSKITTYGVTTVIGLLGTDGTTRSLQSLLAKCRALEEEGINALNWTGCYQFPTRTITDSSRDDIILIDKIIGIGEIAIADTRGSKPNEEDIERLALECRVGGLLSGKSGVLHIHVGDDKEGILSLIRIISESPVLAKNMLPTHINRNENLLHQGVEYINKGGYLDLTTGIYRTENDKESIDASMALKYLLENGCSIEHVTMSSDSNGSMPLFNAQGELEDIGVGSIESNIIEFRKMINRFNIPIEKALMPFTINPAKILRLKHIGEIKIDKQADLIIMNKDLSIDYVICKGKTLVKNGDPIKFGVFEQK
ncbi:beta-aspartyl-dipeptidase (metallo-type) [Clostridium cavendishii DSM 21758]|uniref:Isoaspartyl dipeptidase n=1 Tax=Clostridium cavendishii DSM 21758 TaxID=1121302 RepID=A0A1M6BFH6_9CLOT|nr:beta-aspartyl-peptidase [Clostridium cavendishii]SHI47465.1 beta-aspartyl-dipeptidase (metallo-type) [Clostridium cavendishii DSM 21758]